MVIRLEYPLDFADEMQRSRMEEEATLETGSFCCHVLKSQPRDSWDILKSESIM